MDFWRFYNSVLDFRLAADEFAPTADFGGDAVGTGELLAHGLSEEEGGLWFC